MVAWRGVVACRVYFFFLPLGGGGILDWCFLAGPSSIFRMFCLNFSVGVRLGVPFTDVDAHTAVLDAVS